MKERKDCLMSLKSILILTTVSAAALCALGSIEWKMVNRYEQEGEPYSAPESSATGRVTKATVHAAPSADFLLAHLARQYSNDMRTVSGRVKWHGKPVRQEIDMTNRMCKIERYADGTVHVEPFAPPKPRGVVTNSPAWKKKAAARRAAIEARRNVLPGLKDAQLKMHDAKHSQSNVTININIGGK